MKFTRRIALLPAVAVLLAACSGGSPSPSGGTESMAESMAPESMAESMAPSAAANDYLARIMDAGVIVVSTDPEYPPQSYLDADSGDFMGFDIDVATEIAKRLGVDVQFETPSWDAITAGHWSGRWDMSVGSMTITQDRKAVIDFTQPYYYTPAQMATYTDSGITSLADLANKTVCAGSSTTYLDWLDGNLTLTEEAGDVATPPDGVQSTSFETDINCADAWRSGRHDFEGWLSSSTTVAGAIAADYPVVTVGDPVFYEPLAVAFDNSVDDNDSLVAAVDDIIGQMHDDGTLSELSKKWFCADGSYPCENPDQDGLDLTTR